VCPIGIICVASNILHTIAQLPVVFYSLRAGSGNNELPLNRPLLHWSSNEIPGALRRSFLEPFLDINTPFLQSVNFAAALKAKGNGVEFAIVPAAQHGLSVVQQPKSP
jgi:hypothetical protein